MKKMKSTCEFASERSELLLRNFRQSIAAQSKISAAKAFKEATESPAPRFWVSEARAMRIISILLKGEDPTRGMHSEKREMYLEIFRRVKQIKERNPEIPLGDIVFEVVNSPAPKFYITPHYSAYLIYKAKKKSNGLNQ